MPIDRAIDISVPVTESLAVWPGCPKTVFKRRKSIARGDRVDDTDIFCNVHVGTHIDAPAHFLKGGRTIDAIPPEKMTGKVFVLDVPGVKEITAGILEKKLSNIPGIKKLLLKTDNSALWETSSREFNKDFAGLTEDGAEWVASHHIHLAGIDYLSIQRFYDKSRVHDILLEAGVVILEGLNLKAASQGWYTLVCLPMKLMGVEAAPVRAVLLPEGERL